MNKLLILFLMCCSLSVQSKSWNEIFSNTEVLQFKPDFPQLETPVLLNNTLVFKALSNDRVGLWSLNTQSNQLINLIPADENHNLSEMVQMGETLYFLLRKPNEEYIFKLWRTDGSPSGTSLVSDIAFRQDILSIKENTLFAGGNDGAILEYDGEELIVHDYQLYNHNLRHICVFGPQDFIVYINGNSPKIIRITENTLTDLSVSIPGSFIMRNMVNIDNDCYIHTSEDYSFNAAFDVLKVSQEGITTLFSESESLNTISDVFEHNNQKFAFRKNQDEDESSSLVSLSSDDVILNFDFTLSDGFFTQKISTRNQLMINFQQHRTGNNSHYLFDSAMNHQLIRSGRHFDLPSHHPSLNEDTLVFTEDDNPGNIDLTTVRNSGNQSSFKSQGFDFIDAITSEFSSEQYYILQDTESGVKSIFAIKDTPNIGRSINGIWSDPELENQGLFIKQGTRDSGAEYIFATIYTFKDGKPFWLAGTSNYIPNQESIQINLFDYRGTEFLEQVEEPIENTFGTIQIKMTGCDDLEATVTQNNDQSFEFLFNRLNNTTYKKYCLEQVDP